MLLPLSAHCMNVHSFPFVRTLSFNLRRPNILHNKKVQVSSSVHVFMLSDELIKCVQSYGVKRRKTSKPS